MLKDLVNITKEEIEESAQQVVEGGYYITDECDYYADKLCAINLANINSESINNGKTHLEEGVYNPIERGNVKVNKKKKI